VTKKEQQAAAGINTDISGEQATAAGSSSREQQASGKPPSPPHFVV
jgi:hypothetical protein